MNAYMLSSVAVDLDITELVDGNVAFMRCVRKNIFMEQKGNDLFTELHQRRRSRPVLYISSLREVMKHFLFVVALASVAFTSSSAIGQKNSHASRNKLDYEGGRFADAE